MIVYNKENEPQQLGSLLAKGGEGEIYPLISDPNIVVKCYFPEKLKKDGDFLFKKIKMMSELYQTTFKPHKKKISWVAIPVYNKQKQWIGYAMPKMQGYTLRTLAHALLYKKHAPNLNRLHITKLMLSWLNTIEMLHSKNVMIGDYNLQNFLWNPDTLTVGFIDCDSYQIKTENKFFPCLVGSPDLTAPEHHGKDFRQIVRTPESEYFSIAIILFMCFMLGRHPYDIIGGSDPVQNMKNGQFPYGVGNNGGKRIPKGDWYNIWSHMSFDMKSLFIKTFTQGAKDPKRRATIVEWKRVLKKYIYETGKGYHNIDIRPAEPKNSSNKAKPST